MRDTHRETRVALDSRDRTTRGGWDKSAGDASEDPPLKKLEARSDMTVNELCDVYFAQPIIITNAGHRRRLPPQDRQKQYRPARPSPSGPKRVGSLTRLDIEKFQIDIASGKTAADVKTKKQGRAIVRVVKELRRVRSLYSSRS